MFERFKSRWEDFLEAHPDLTDYLAFGKSLFPPINFISLHYAYFIVSSLFFSGIFYASSTPGDSIRYIDCLFLVVSAMTDTGLNTVNLSQINTWQQVLMFLLFIFGSAIWISFLTVIARKHAFEKRFDHIVEAGREERRQRRLFAQENQTSGPSIRQFLSFDRFSSNTGQPIRRFFTMDRFKSSPPEVNTLPGLGSRQPPVEMEETEKYSRQVNSPLRRVVSAPEEDIPSDLDNEISKTTTLASQAPPPSPRDHISFIETLPVPPNTGGATSSAYQPGNQLPHRTNARRPSTIASEASDESEDFTARWKRILTKGNTSKRGQFFDLSSDEREALGGCEYRALKALAIAVPLYGFVWQFIGALSLSIWIAKNASNRALDNGQNPIWTGIFLSVSAFNNAGMSLMDANMTAFQKDYFPLFVVGMLVLAGNTAYPLFLRFLFWATLKTMQLTTRPARKAHWKETFEFILKYPRRVYTTLFNSRATWWLLGVLFATNIIDWVAFEVLNIGNPVTEAMSINDRIIAGWFQAIAVRAAGFSVVSIAGLYPGVQLLYMIMMYISVFPVSITMRHSNVYEERSLGIYEDDPSALDPEIGESGDFLLPPTNVDSRSRLRRVATGATTAVGKNFNKGLKATMTFHGVGARRPPKNADDNSRISFIGQQIRGQLAHDLWWLVLPLLIIMIIETDHYLEQPIHYAVFNILMEVVSAYGNVGLSVGVPDNSYSFSGGWHTGSKFVLCLVMLRGRHRGLPVALDKAVRLPGDKLYAEEEEDQRIRKIITMERSQRGDMSRDITRED